jgi:hypothetical protein
VARVSQYRDAQYSVDRFYAPGATRINDFVAARKRYVPDSTSALTTAAEAFALAVDVRQDYAHITVAVPTCGLSSALHFGAPSRVPRRTRGS